MFGSQILDIAIGLSFVYLVLSLACAGLAEVILRAIESRAKFLREGLVNLLETTSAEVDQLYQHPLLRAFRGRKGFLLREGSDPTALDTRSFTLALTSEYLAPTGQADGLQPPTYGTVRARVAAIEDGERVKRDALLALLDEARGDLDAWKKGVERWFDAAMVETGSWYKRQTRGILFLIAVALCTLLNLDSLMMARLLWQNTAMRESIVAMAENFRASANEEQPSAPPAEGDAEAASAPDEEPLPSTKVTAGDASVELERFAVIRDELIGLGLLGWSSGWMGEDAQNQRGLPDTFGRALLKLAGLMVSVFAATVGAPFWFNVVQSLFGLRSKVTGTQDQTEPKP